jgi:dihydroorotate dehydrogenase
MYRRFIKPLLFLLPAERAHRVAFGALRLLMALPFVAALVRRWLSPEQPSLRVRAFGLDFPTPILLAAGFDKNAEGYEALGALGFGGVEVGTVTAEAQPGNPTPRLFRLPADRALVNRMGFNNDGAERVALRLHRPRRTLVGVNLGKTRSVSDEDAIDDYVASARRVGAFADYVVVNVSSPNTPGLRGFQAADRLRPLLLSVREELNRARPERPPALLVKIAPDLGDDAIEAIGDLALEIGLDGIIATNTTTSRDELRSDVEVVDAIGAGGLSGAPLKTKALVVLERLRAKVQDRVVLIAAGGIETADDVWDRIRAGATLVQIYTAFVYEGPGLPRRLAHGLAERLRAACCDHLEEAVGSGRTLDPRSVRSSYRPPSPA